jgi:hypothetical protein
VPIHHSEFVISKTPVAQSRGSGLKLRSVSVRESLLKTSCAQSARGACPPRSAIFVTRAKSRSRKALCGSASLRESNVCKCKVVEHHAFQACPSRCKPGCRCHNVNPRVVILDCYRRRLRRRIIDAPISKRPALPGSGIVEKRTSLSATRSPPATICPCSSLLPKYVGCAQLSVITIWM